MRKTRFTVKCRAVADLIGINVEFYEDKRLSADIYEDDGTLHIRRKNSKVDACFDVSNCQSDNSKEQNRKTRSVLTALGMETKITDRVLVDEIDEDDDLLCPHCGEPL